MVPRVEVDPGGGVIIEWPDGHQSRFPFEDLRAVCPCATCREGKEGSGHVSTPRSPEASRLLKITPVGRYAISALWGDGHSTGIYSWEFLRERCGCLPCRLARKEVQG
jgi:DUF971 family protein